jgi:hypothetical protein
MNRIMRPLLTVLASVASAVLLSAAPAHAADPLANVPTGDFATYCKAHGHADAKLVAQNAYGWRCVSSSGQQVTLSIAAVCREVTVKDDEPTVLDFLDDFTRVDDYAWGCYRLSQVAPLGRLDVKGYCQSQGYEGVLVGDTAVSWECRSPGYSFAVNSVGILTNACAATYPSSRGTVRARVVDFNNPNAIDCMV